MRTRHRTLGLVVLGRTRCGKSQHLGRRLCGVFAHRNSASSFLALPGRQSGCLYDSYGNDPLWPACRNPFLLTFTLQSSGIV